MKPLHLNDSELDAVMAAARPLAERDRSPFLAAVATAIREAGEEIGPGRLHRLIRETQRKFCDAPDLTPRKYR
jgi:hypothetical protein